MVKGVVRPIDNLGRVCIPKEIRRSLDIGEFEPVDIYLSGTTICIDKAYVKCVCCGKTEADANLLDYKGVMMRPDCHPDKVTL